MKISEIRAAVMVGCLAFGMLAVPSARGEDDVLGWEPEVVLKAMAAEGADPFEFFFKETKLERGAFLGVTTSEVMPAMRAQLKLPKGVGLLVEQVEAGSPAEAAGLKRFDILHKVDDQLVINGEQLAVLVRMHKAGEELKIAILREGKEMTLSAKLTEKDLEPIAKRAQSALEMAKALTANQKLRDWNGNLDGMISAKMNIRGERSASMKDSEHTLTLKCDADDQKRLEVKDKSGETVFDGPVNTEEEREKLPDGVLEKLKRLERAVPPKVVIKMPAFEGPAANMGNAFRSSKERSTTWSDAEGSVTVEVKERDNRRQAKLTVKDANGGLTYSGPIDTEEQRKALPEDIRKKLEGKPWKQMLEGLKDSEDRD